MAAYEEPIDGVADNDKPSYSSSSPIAAALNFWKDFDLEGEGIKLDEQGKKIAENQEISLKNMRRLAESTRDFRKASNEEKLNLFNSLLKAYQEELDNLTKRATFGENAFLNIYLRLSGAPDPCPALVSAAELEEYRAHLKHEQATIWRQEEHNWQLEQQIWILQMVMEEKVKEIFEIKQRTLAEENQKTLELLKEMLEMLLQEQLQTAKKSVSNIWRLHEFGQTQLFEFRAQSEEERAAKQLELNLLTGEVERAQAQLGLKREKEHLQSQLHAVNSEQSQHKEREETDTRASLEASLSAKKIISVLQAELHKLEAELSNEGVQHLAVIKRLNRLLNDKALGYNSIEAEDWDVDTRGEDMTKLETLLLDKKVKLSEKTTATEASEAKLEEFATKVDEQQQVISKIKELLVKDQEQLKELLVKEPRYSHELQNGTRVTEKSDSHELENSTRVTEKSATNVYGVTFSSNATSFALVPTVSVGSGSTSAFTSVWGSSPSLVRSSPSFGSDSIPAFGGSSTSATSSSTPAFGTSSASTCSTPPFGGRSSVYGSGSTSLFVSSSMPQLSMAQSFGASTSSSSTIASLFGPGFGGTAVSAFIGLKTSSGAQGDNPSQKFIKKVKRHRGVRKLI